jgi:hypothetical protein
MSKCASGFVKKTLQVDEYINDISDNDVNIINDYVYYNHFDESNKTEEKKPVGIRVGTKNSDGSVSYSDVRGVNASSIAETSVNTNFFGNRNVFHSIPIAKPLFIDMCVKKCNNGSFPHETKGRSIPATKDHILAGGNFECRDNASTQKDVTQSEIASSQTVYQCVTGVVDNSDVNNPICRYKPTQYPIEFK